MSLARARSFGLVRRQLAAPIRRNASTNHGGEQSSFPKEGVCMHAVSKRELKQWNRLCYSVLA